jgi:hypothetical protein
MDRRFRPSDAALRPPFLIALGWIGVLSCAVFAGAVVIADLMVPDQTWMADTISDLGAGELEYIVDIGLYAFSAGLIACALGAAHIHLGGARWSWGIAGLAFLGLTVFLVGARNEYGDGDNEGVVIHDYLVYALGFLFFAVPMAMSFGARAAGVGFLRAFRIGAVLWALAAPPFFFVPDTVDGAYERGLMLLAFIFVVALGRLLISEGRRVG